MLEARKCIPAVRGGDGDREAEAVARSAVDRFIMSSSDGHFSIGMFILVGLSLRQGRDG